MYCKNNMSCPVKVNSNTIELKVHTSCYCVLDLLVVTSFFMIHHLTSYFVDLVFLHFSIQILATFCSSGSLGSSGSEYAYYNGVVLANIHLCNLSYKLGTQICLA